MNVNILYTRFTSPLSDLEYQKLLGFLPTDQKERNQRFVRWQDRHSHLFGKLLLKASLKMYGFEEDCLDYLQYNKYDRPYINGDIDFNISHSGEYVVCAIAKGIRLGVDIEKVHKLELNAFNGIMTNEQWQDINEDNNPTSAFFKYWTVKESVVKADSRGLSIPLLELHIIDDKVSYDNSIWHLHQLDFDSKYCACLATDIQHINSTIKYMSFYLEESTGCTSALR